jgi:hypothetical protein
MQIKLLRMSTANAGCSFRQKFTVVKASNLIVGTDKCQIHLMDTMDTLALTVRLKKASKRK